MAQMGVTSLGNGPKNDVDFERRHEQRHGEGTSVQNLRVCFKLSAACNTPSPQIESKAQACWGGLPLARARRAEVSIDLPSVLNQIGLLGLLAVFLSVLTP